MEIVINVSVGRVFCGIYYFEFELLKLVELKFIEVLEMVILKNLYNV